jgi:hypothetical protein
MDLARLSVEDQDLSLGLVQCFQTLTIRAAQLWLQYVQHKEVALGCWQQACLMCWFGENRQYLGSG